MIRHLSLFLLAALLWGGCGSSHRLHEVQFDGERMAVVAAIPPRPIVFTDGFGDARVDPDDPIGSFFRAGTALAKYAEVREAQARMDSALAEIDVAERIAAQTLLDGARHLGYIPVDRPADADYVLDLRVADYGLVADSWNAEVHFEVNAEMILVDRRTRRTIWKERIRTTEPVTDVPLGLGTSIGNVVTAAALSNLSVEEMVVALEHLADFTARQFTGKLRHDYYDSRPHAAR